MSMTGAADRGQIERGTLHPGQKLAAEWELAVAMGVSRSTLRRIPGRGGGTYIAAGKVDRDLSRIVGVRMLLRDQGFTAGSRVVRVQLADGVPISLEHAVLPAELVPGLPERDPGGSLYELLDAEYSLRPEEATEHIEVVSASSDEATILSIERGAPLISITRTTRDAEGVAFEYSHDLFRADRTRITVKVKGSPSSEKARLRGRVVELVP